MSLSAEAYYGKVIVHKRLVAKRIDCAYLDGHTSTVEAEREQCPLTQHSLETTSEFDLGNRECMTEMKTSVHVGVRERSEPLGILRPDFRRRHGGGRGVNGLGIGGGGRSRCIDLEHLLVKPVLLSLLFEFDNGISLASLEIHIAVSGQT